ncbi:MAG: helix-turn-helix transcriptional regulator [Bosea sp.]|nr:helix-turn-helix transcriptional regulator [Bosea sp. (in: a-proteobacteria)]
MAGHQTYDRRFAACPVEVTLDLIDGKWKGVVLYHLGNGPLRFNELRRVTPNTTQRMLTKQLRELEADGLVIRTVYPEIPPRVDYRLSARGESLQPIIAALKAWGTQHLAEMLGGAEGDEAAAEPLPRRRASAA